MIKCFLDYQRQNVLIWTQKSRTFVTINPLFTSNDLQSRAFLSCQKTKFSSSSWCKFSSLWTDLDLEMSEPVCDSDHHEIT